MRIDRTTWSATTSPAPPPPDGAPFFGLRTTPADVLVAEVDGAVAGYVSIRPATELQASSHVQHVNGLAVDPELQGRGVGRALVEAAVAEARRRGARRLTLRVLGPNVAARRLYDACGFVVEGVLRCEFFLDGEDVDDVLMARTL
jgi:ribosomal protein S18 acetylase RimI-like enzyme